MSRKKRHSLKLQPPVQPITQWVLSVAVSQQKLPDLSVLRALRVNLHPATELLVDTASSGNEREHRCFRTPRKSSKHHPLTAEQRASHRHLAQQRLAVERVIRRVKILLILKETCRYRRRRVLLQLTLSATSCNLIRRLPA
ncbi:transposase family protein [Deinococcus sp.]|uniref:transposase family protein n=1 Tax=Deinococcus sp. TaxID=47478 RepID=UPI003C7E47B8